MIFDNLLITICARGGSKGLPNKNILPIQNKPLIQYTIESSFAFKSFVEASRIDIALSTDSIDIISKAAVAGLTTNYIRPEKLARSNTGKVETIADILKYQESINSCRYDYIIDLDVTSPLRTVNDIYLALTKLHENPDALNIFSVNHAEKSPYFNLVEIKENGFFETVCESNFLSRQEAPEVYSMNSSIFIYRREYFERDYNKTISDKSMVFLMDHLCIDIDDLNMFNYVEYLIITDKWNLLGKNS